MISGSTSGVWIYSTIETTPTYSVLNSAFPILEYSASKEDDLGSDNINIFKGTSKIKSIKYGSKNVKYIYVGDTCIYDYNTSVLTVQGSSYIVAHLFIENNNTPHLSTIISDLNEAQAHTHKKMLYEGFYIKPYLYNNGTPTTPTLSNFTVNVWIKDVKLGKSNYLGSQAFYYEDPDNIVGIYVRSGKYLLSDFIDTDDKTTSIQEGFLLLFNLSQFSLLDPIPSTSPNGQQPTFQHKPLYRVQVSNALDSLVVVGASGTQYTTYV